MYEHRLVKICAFDDEDDDDNDHDDYFFIMCKFSWLEIARIGKSKKKNDRKKNVCY